MKDSFAPDNQGFIMRLMFIQSPLRTAMHSFATSAGLTRKPASLRNLLVLAAFLAAPGVLPPISSRSALKASTMATL